MFDLSDFAGASDKQLSYCEENASVASMKAAFPVDLGGLKILVVAFHPLK